jgi:hypothetical protein
MRTCLLRRPGPEGRRHWQRAVGLLYRTKNDSQQIVYAGTPPYGHTWELFWMGNEPVRGWDLTAAAKGAPIVCGSHQ